MDIRAWDERYRSAERPTGKSETEPTPLLKEIAAQRRPGRVLDLACGLGRNALWLAEQGWSVTAVDGAPAAIEILRECASRRALKVEAHIADLEKHEYRIERSAWDLIAFCYYLQRDLFEPAKLGVAPGGVLLAIVHITAPDEEPTYKRMRPGELRSYFHDWDILHYYEGKPKDPEHRRAVAEAVARRPTSGRTLS